MYMFPCKLCALDWEVSDDSQLMMMTRLVVWTLLLFSLALVLADDAEEDRDEDIPLHRCYRNTHTLCADRSTCISKKWMCDGRRDCPDWSDERPAICQKMGKKGINYARHYSIKEQGRCPGDYFFCKDGSYCLDPVVVCDGRPDCRDGSDEESFCYVMKTQMQRTRDHTIVYKK